MPTTSELFVVFACNDNMIVQFEMGSRLLLWWTPNVHLFLRERDMYLFLNDPARDEYPNVTQRVCRTRAPLLVQSIPIRVQLSHVLPCGLLYLLTYGYVSSHRRIFQVVYFRFHPPVIHYLAHWQHQLLLHMFQYPLLITNQWFERVVRGSTLQKDAESCDIT